MLVYWIDFLSKYLDYPLFPLGWHTSMRMMLALITSLLVSIFLGPFFIRKLYAWKIGQPIRKEECPLLGALHRNKENTPTMGGVLILSSMLLSLIFWMDPHHIFTWILLFTTLFLGFVGGYDDYLKLRNRNAKGLSAKKKFLFQGILSFLLVTYFLSPELQQNLNTFLSLAPPIIKEASIEGKMTMISLPSFMERIYVPFRSFPLFEMGSFLTLIWTFCVISGASNGVNLTDGLDGLASGCLIMTASCFALLAFVSNNIDLAEYLKLPYIEGGGEIGVYLAAMIGSILGFLWYNGHPAQIFMGDVGSLTLGGILGVSSFLLKREPLLALVGGVFVIEALSVIIQVLSFRYRNKKRVFLCAPLHHHFEYQGWAETKVVIRFWIVALLLSLLGILSLKIQTL